MATMPAPPLRSFASDNAAGAHPRVIEAIAAANVGHALAYGDDRWTAEAEARLRELFGPASQSFLVWGGTGANTMSLATMLGPAQGVICARSAHIATDETGAPERFLGAKLIELPAADGKLVPDQIDEQARALGDVHHVQPGVVSITQSTELGTVYTPDEVAALCEAAHRRAMRVHMDGARFANAVAALGGTRDALRSITVEAGVDVVTFGGTKNGLIGAEAVVYLAADLARSAPFVRKQVTQLPSKMRFVAAQFNAVLEGDLWIDLARNANDMAQRLHRATCDLPGVAVTRPSQCNAVFAALPCEAVDRLQEWSFFWVWDRSRNPADGRSEVRWMTSWDTTPHDVDAFVAGVREVLRSSTAQPPADR